MSEKRKTKLNARETIKQNQLLYRSSKMFRGGPDEADAAIPGDPMSPNSESSGDSGSPPRPEYRAGE